MQNHAPTIYAYSGLNTLFDGEFAGGIKTRLPGLRGESGNRAARSVGIVRGEQG
jgi:hypothetical protein